MRHVRTLILWFLLAVATALAFLLFVQSGGEGREPACAYRLHGLFHLRPFPGRRFPPHVKPRCRSNPGTLVIIR